MKEYKYTTTFASKIIPVKSEEDKSKFISLASKNDNIKKLLPKDADLTSNDGWVVFIGESFVPNSLNLNNDGVESKDGINMANHVPFTYINLSHNRLKTVGVAVSSILTDFKTGKEITEAEALKTNEPFSVTIIGIIWRAPNPQLAEAIENINEKDSYLHDSVSLSWECAFDSMELVLLDKNETQISKGSKITDEKEIDKLSSKLLTNGGSGLMENGQKIGRIPINPTLLGFGLVETPAAPVQPIQADDKQNNSKDNSSKADLDKIKDIYNLIKEKVLEELKDESLANSKQNLLSESFTNQLKSMPESGMGYHICDIELNDGTVLPSVIISNCSILPSNINTNNIKNIISQSSDLTVIKNNEDISNKENNNIMATKIEKIEQLTDENLKELKASVIQELFASNSKMLLDEGIKKISEDYSKQIAEKETAIKAATELAEQSKNLLAETQEKLAKLEESHNKMVQINEQREKLEAFSARMETIEDKFDLDDKQKEIVANKVKTLTSSEDFDAYMAEIEVLLAAKKKVAKKDGKSGEKPGDKMNDKEPDADDDEKKKKEAKASADAEAQKAIDEALKNGKQDDKNLLPNGGAKEETLAEKAKRVFGVEGWQVVNKRANRI